MPVFEIKFNHLASCPYFHEAETVEAAIDRVINYINTNSRSKVSTRDVIYAEETTKVPLRSVAKAFTKSIFSSF